MFGLGALPSAYTSGSCSTFNGYFTSAPAYDSVAPDVCFIAGNAGFELGISFHNW
jgi:hypothetical protein